MKHLNSEIYRFVYLDVINQHQSINNCDKNYNIITNYESFTSILWIIYAHVINQKLTVVWLWVF